MFTVYHGNLESSKSVGTNELIKKGAKLVTCIDDIVKNYPFLKNRKNNVKKVNIGNHGDIYNFIKDKPIEIDELIRVSKKNNQEILSELLMLEIDGKIKKISGNRYIKV